MFYGFDIVCMANSNDIDAASEVASVSPFDYETDGLGLGLQQIPDTRSCRVAAPLPPSFPACRR